MRAPAQHRLKSIVNLKVAEVAAPGGGRRHPSRRRTRYDVSINHGSQLSRWSLRTASHAAAGTDDSTSRMHGAIGVERTFPSTRSQRPRASTRQCGERIPRLPRACRVHAQRRLPIAELSNRANEQPRHSKRCPPTRWQKIERPNESKDDGWMIGRVEFYSTLVPGSTAGPRRGGPECYRPTEPELRQEIHRPSKSASDVRGADRIGNVSRLQPAATLDRRRADAARALRCAAGLRDPSIASNPVVDQRSRAPSMCFGARIVGGECKAPPITNHAGRFVGGTQRNSQ